MANHAGLTPQWLTSSYLEPIMQEALKSPALKIHNIVITPGSNVGDNYACQIFRISIDFTENGNQSKKSIIAKYLPKTKLLDSVVESDIYGTESRYYKMVLPLQRKYTKLANFAPICLGVDDEKKTFFMEDLVVKGFRLPKRGVPLDKAQCEIVIDALATFHGTSLYALEENPKLPEVFNKVFWSGERCESMYNLFAMCQGALNRCCPDYDMPEKYKSALRGMFDQYRKEYFKV